MKPRWLLIGLFYTVVSALLPIRSPERVLWAQDAGERNSATLTADNFNGDSVHPSFAQRCMRASLAQEVRNAAGHISYWRGDFPLIIAAPHGGRIRPRDYPVRSSSNAVLTTDVNTDLLAECVWNELRKSVGRTPCMVICRIQRKFLDANRPPEAACAADSPAIQDWQDYQAAITASRRMTEEKFGRGLFLELHGHGHPNRWIELGYLLRARDFDLPAVKLGAKQNNCSVREILSRGQVDLDTLLRGEQSLGHFLDEYGLSAVPSPKIPRPGRAPYFNGGWNTVQHGSRDSGTISSIQMEFYRPGLRDNPENVAAASKSIAAAIEQFLITHYSTDSLQGS